MCSTSGSTHLSVNGGRLASTPVAFNKEDRRCRRWRGRRQSIEAKDYVEALRGSSSDCREPMKGAEASDTDGSPILTDTKMVVYLINIDLDVHYVKYLSYLCCGILWQSNNTVDENHVGLLQQLENKLYAFCKIKW